MYSRYGHSPVGSTGKVLKGLNQRSLCSFWVKYRPFIKTIVLRRACGEWLPSNPLCHKTSSSSVSGSACLFLDLKPSCWKTLQEFEVDTQFHPFCESISNKVAIGPAAGCDFRDYLSATPYTHHTQLVYIHKNRVQFGSEFDVESRCTRVATESRLKSRTFFSHENWHKSRCAPKLCSCTLHDGVHWCTSRDTGKRMLLE